MEIKSGKNKFYIGESESQALAYITFADGQQDNVIVADHTFVKPELRGQNVARALLDRLANYAREHNLKIKPVCSYVVKSFEKSSAYNDVKM